jgi:hypothetical protein
VAVLLSVPVVATGFGSSLETVFGFFGGCVAVHSRGGCRWRAFGVGLGGGCCTPPNDRDVSVANSILGGSGRRFRPQTESYPQGGGFKTDLI